MPPSRVKPGRWAWNRQLLEPKFRELARGLTTLIPAWEGSGLPYDLVNSVSATASLSDLSPASWVATDQGLGLDYDTGRAGFLDTDVRAGIYQIQPDWTALVVLVPGGGAIGGDPTILAHVDATGFGGWRFYVQTTGTDDWAFAWNGTLIRGSAVGWPVSDRHLVYVRREAGSEWDIGQAVIGEEVTVLATASDATDPSTVDDTLSLNSAQNDQNLNPMPAAADRVVMIWDRALTDTELELVTSDPFGLLRRDMAIPTVIISGGPATVSRTGTSDLVFTTTAAGTRTALRTGTSGLVFSTTGTGLRTALGTGTSSLVFTATGTGLLTALRTGTSSLVFTVVGTGANQSVYTFTPTTRLEAIEGPEQTSPSMPSHVSIWRLYGTPIPTSWTVLITSGVATPPPGIAGPTVFQIKGNPEVPNATATYTGADAGSGDDGRAVFRGGITYSVTTAERNILVAAGYSMD